MSTTRVMIGHSPRNLKSILKIDNTKIQTMSDAKEFQTIFIVGMPRSGTTLVEQILASHSQVHGAGELSAMSMLVNPITSRFSDFTDWQNQKQLFEEDISGIRLGYLQVLHDLKVNEKNIVDKMSLNFFLLGFILSAFPDAKIINVKRNPMAVCWSIYKHNFSDGGHGYAYHLGDIAEFYNLYLDMMSFWHERFPDNINELGYEELSENQEFETRRLLAFCELDWQQSCIDFHKTIKPVNTASTVQVRKKMYQGSSQDWRHYSDFLELELQDILR